MTDEAAAFTGALTFTADDVDIIDRQTPYQGYFRIDRYRLRHRLFAGGWSETMVREVFERGHAVAVLPYDPVRDRVVLLEQFRAGALAAGWQPWMFEVVAGIIEPGQTAAQTARRETDEESGCTVGRLELISEYLVSPGGATESVSLFIGEVDSSAAAGLHGLAQENEDIKVHVIPAEQAIALADQGTIRNAMTLLALWWLARHRPDLQQRWRAGTGDPA